MANYKEEMKLTDEEISQHIQQDCKMWCPTKGEFLQEVGEVISKAQLEKLQPIIAALKMELKIARETYDEFAERDRKDIAVLKAENEELKNGKVALQMAAQLLLQDILELKLQLSTARAEVEELKKNVDIYEELLANVLDVMNEADVELPYLAPDKGGK